ncbi:hypothetical protein H8356DRAFT_970531, partial [Neocallimastix lanati (nom. inval.)]
MRNNNFNCNRVDTGTLPRIGGSRRDAEIWKFKINDWFKREGITTDENKFSYIITAVEDNIVRILMEKEKEVNRALTLDECVKLIKKKYWRENLKEDKLSQLKKIIITPNENVCDFNTRFLELYDQLDFNDKSYISVIDYEYALRPRGRIYEMVVMADVDNLEDACRLAEKFESIINKSRVGNEIWGSYTTNIKNNYNDNDNNSNLNVSNDNNISNHYRNRKILKSNFKISSSNSSTNNNKVNSNNDKNNSNINNVNENIINNNSINNIINNGISNLDTNNTNNNNNNNNYNND